MQEWEEGWPVFLSTRESLQEAVLLKTIPIRTQPLDVVDGINRQVAHSYGHVGQMVYPGKWRKDEDGPIPFPVKRWFGCLQPATAKRKTGNTLMSGTAIKKEQFIPALFCF